MSSRKRQRSPDDVDGEEPEVEIESTSSSFRMNNQHTKRSRVAMAQAAGGSVVSDDEDFENDFLRSDIDEPVNNIINDDDERSDEEDADQDAFDYSLRQNSDDDEEEEDEIDEIRATQFVEKQLRKHKENLAAESGVITEVHMFNFMCHENLKIELGPLINFIIGHNGSGKSAILTALQICLGNKASGTNRAKSLKGMIKAGTDSARVQVKIKNEGDNAFKPQLYGEVVIVERHFNTSGTSGFKLKSADGRQISSKKSELDEMLDFFGLQMDNPINVLTQDLSRQFLSNSTPSEKYRFFIKGTQLETLDSDYKIIEDQIDQLELKLTTRDDDMADKRRLVRDAERVKKEADETMRLDQRMHAVRRQHAWVQVQDQEKNVEDCKKNVTLIQDFVGEKEQVFEEANTRHEAQNEAVQAAQRGVDTIQEGLVPLEQQRDAANEHFQTNKTELLTHVAHHRQIREDLKSANKEITRLKKEIEEERQRLEGADGEAHVQRCRELDVLKQKAADAQQASRDHDENYATLERAERDAYKRFQDSKAPHEEARSSMSQAKRRLDQFEREKGQKWAAYPQAIQNLSRELERETRWKSKPVGPLGMYVSLLKPEWGFMIETIFGGTLNAFVVTSKYDQTLLSQIAKRINCSCLILIGTPEPLDTSDKEPDRDLDTILRVLRIENNLVRNTLIINHTVEQTVLHGDRNTDSVVKFMYEGSRPRNVRAALTMGQRGAGQRWEYSRNGDRKVGPVRAWNGRLRLQVDHEQELQQLKDDLQEKQDSVRRAEDDFRTLRQAHEHARQALARHKKESQSLKASMQRAEDNVESKQNEIDVNRPEDGKLQELERQLEEAQGDKRVHSEAFTDAEEVKVKLDDKARELKQALEQAQQDCEVKMKQLEKANIKLERCTEGREKTLRELNAKEDDVRRAKRAVNEREETLKEAEATLKHFIEEASSISDRVPVEKGMTGEKLEALLERLKEDLRKAYGRQGITREEAAAALAQAQRELEEAKNQTKDMKDVATQLKKALSERQRRWGLFRKYISMRTRIQFIYLLSERKFRGRVILDHVERTLEISVEPDDTKRSDAGRQAKTLSGGEKSFSTICLLLSIWEAMGSQIRCLDEFDVFMDSVNRQQSMGLMIQTARRAVGRQFILITPQSMGGIERDDDVSIFKMGDPERAREPGQTALNFAAA